ncbi:biopolymer transporter ExbB [Xenorhabdus budapestensis]|uniref:Biopolymer transporter ExbB n=1 Tax=Xenorhabdus budapestensis TaxID=290110 RepID=A0ABX7VGS3_XENBU|nr:biopolymer transporter ExbB [Xenorhabdus budapestensis]QTL39853.1 biopolymer transporter ExbB [Xenorhabdus budapestensis]
MTKKHKVAPALILILLPYIIVIILYFTFKYYLVPDISFAKNRGALGGAIASSSYAGTTIAVLIAALTFVIGLKGRNITKLNHYGYMTSVVIMYSFVFVELGILFFSGILLISNITGIPLPSITIGIAIASFIHICLLLFQLFNFSKKS